MVAQEGEGNFLYRLPRGGLALLAKKAWPDEKAARLRFLKSCSHPTQITIEEYGRLQEEGGILVYRQVRKWLAERKAFVIEWLDNPLERENRDLSSALQRLRAQAAKVHHSGGSATRRKHEPEHQAIREIVKKASEQKQNRKLNRGRFINKALEECEKAGHRTSRSTIVRHASEFLPPLSKAKP
jgi:hypothetical protein